MDNVLCDGNESELTNCRFDGWGHHDCDISEAAGVICQIEQEPEQPKPKVLLKKYKHHLHKHHKMEVRLNGGRTSNEGRVEVSLIKLYICKIIRLIVNVDRFALESHRGVRSAAMDGPCSKLM